jgi:hypothetical protein
MPAVTIFQGSVYDRLGSYTPLMVIMIFAALHLDGILLHVSKIAQN